MTDILLKVWDELNTGMSPPGIVARRFRPDVSVDLFLGIERPSATYLIFVQASRTSFARNLRWPTSSGFITSQETVPEDGKKMRLVVRLTSPTYRDLFATIVNDVFECVAPAMTERAALQSIAGRLDKWQRFFAQHGGEGLSPLAQRGLYGELWFLKEFLLPCCGSRVAIENWTGPLAKDQDFQLSSGTFEVKTSTTSPDYKIHVSNVRQLDDSANHALFLVHVALEERHSQGLTLPGLVENIRSAAGDQIALFNERLHQAGYLDSHASRYSSAGYVVKSRQFFRVERDFPRIREQELRPGVGNVSYTITLGSCMPFEVPDTEVNSLLKGACDPSG